MDQVNKKLENLSVSEAWNIQLLRRYSACLVNGLLGICIIALLAVSLVSIKVVIQNSLPKKIFSQSQDGMIRDVTSLARVKVDG